MFLADWKIIAEVSFLLLFILAGIAVASFFLIRSLIASFKEVFKYQSKMDIELRKTINLLSKIDKQTDYSQFLDHNVKQMTYEEKKHMIQLVDSGYEKIDKVAKENQYLVETYENLHEIRRVRDSLVLTHNQKITFFPFNLYAKLLKMKPFDLYTEK